jgi:hypothetical protein
VASRPERSRGRGLDPVRPRPTSPEAPGTLGPGPGPVASRVARPSTGALDTWPNPSTRGPNVQIRTAPVRASADADRAPRGLASRAGSGQQRCRRAPDTVRSRLPEVAVEPQARPALELVAPRSAKGARRGSHPREYAAPTSEARGPMPLWLSELLHDPSLGAELVAGHAGVDRRGPIRWAHISELPDPTPWLEGGELLLTTGLGVKDSPRLQERFVAGVAARGVVALGFAIGVSLEQVRRRCCAPATPTPCRCSPCPTRSRSSRSAGASPTTRSRSTTPRCAGRSTCTGRSCTPSSPTGASTPCSRPWPAPCRAWRSSPSTSAGRSSVAPTRRRRRGTCRPRGCGRPCPAIGRGRRRCSTVGRSRAPRSWSVTCSRPWSSPSAGRPSSSTRSCSSSRA